MMTLSLYQHNSIFNKNLSKIFVYVVLLKCVIGCLQNPKNSRMDVAE